MIIGIVGHEALKFTPHGEMEARSLIAALLLPADATLTSGHCHLGGVDLWAEEIAARLGRQTLIYPPYRQSWDGYRARNIQIAEAADIVHVLAVRVLSPHYTGMRFKTCYHCGTTDHVKGGGCWTAKYARGLGKTTLVHVIENLGDQP
jgi:hypothetical protein